jgi:hypothetical protein
MRFQSIISVLVGMAALSTAQTPGVRYTATTDSVSGAREAIRIDVLRWSTDAERNQLLAAWNLTKPAPPAGGRGAVNTDPFGSFGGRNRPAVADDDPALEDSGPPAPAVGRGGRGGRGGGSGGPPRLTPEASLVAALGKAPVVGHVWSSEVAGYSIHSASRIAQPDGSERIILITDRRLGAWNELWKPVTGEPSAYEFSVIEIHLNPKGDGEGKASLTGKVVTDSAAKTIALENYNSLPVVLRNVKRK